MLTPREAEILALVAEGRSNGEIGKQLFISTKTVSVHVSNILAKLDAASCIPAVVKATANYEDPAVIAEASRGLGEAMVGINVADLPAPHRLSERGW